jgi:pSer/pThr/pTyr-binding forkhead associated (FHA) protein
LSEFVFVEQEPMQGFDRPVESGTTIGREGCDITLSDPDVSRRHAEIEIAAGELSIVDLGSTNGTFVNGDRIDQQRRLRDGDEVRIGSTIWRLRAPTGATRIAETMSAAERGATRPSQTALQSEAEPPAPEPATADQPTALSAPTPPAEAPPAPPRDPSRRGDVPQPDFAPSGIRRIVPVDAPTAFTPETQAGRKGSAATRAGATVMAGAVVALTTAGVVLYYIIEPFK